MLFDLRVTNTTITGDMPEGLAGGVFKPGDEVSVLPSGFSSKIKSIDTFDGPVEEAFAPMSVSMTLEDEIDISRGDMIVRTHNQPTVSQDIEGDALLDERKTATAKR